MATNFRDRLGNCLATNAPLAILATAALFFAGPGPACAQYAPWPHHGHGCCGFGGWWGGYSSTAAEGYLTGWSRVYRALGEANYLNALAASEHRRAEAMSLENQRTRISPVAPTEAEVMTRALPVLSRTSTPQPAQAPLEATLSAAPPKSARFLNPHRERREAEKDLRAFHAEQFRREQAERRLAARLAAESLAFEIEASGGKLEWPEVLSRPEFGKQLCSIEACLERWTRTGSLDAGYRSELKRSVRDLGNLLVRRHLKHPDLRLVEARDLLRNIDVLVTSPPLSNVSSVAQQVR
jgi:hypothetical protein